MKTINDTIQDTFNYFAYEIADLKYILIDIDGAIRGIGGSKQPLDINKLPSYAKNKQIQVNKSHDETDEERLARHVKFFQQMKQAFKPKDTQNNKQNI